MFFSGLIHVYILLKNKMICEKKQEDKVNKLFVFEVLFWYNDFIENEIGIRKCSHLTA